MTLRARGTLWLLALVGGGCVSGSYSRASIDEPLPPGRLEALQAGRDDLQSCLRVLGAPHRVFEYRTERSGPCGAALLWFWRDSSGFGVELSSPSDNVPGSVRFDLSGTELPGCMLWFGPDLVLERWQQGLVGDLLPRVRPGAATGG
jgi:hypothetical protein